jgi:excisionase family DNA binding protein
MATPRLLTPDEAGEILRCSGETIKRYVRSGELRAFRHRGRILIPEHAIERFVEERLTAGGVPQVMPRRRRTILGASFDGDRRLVEFDRRDHE